MKKVDLRLGEERNAGILGEPFRIDVGELEQDSRHISRSSVCKEVVREVVSVVVCRREKVRAPHTSFEG